MTGQKLFQLGQILRNVVNHCARLSARSVVVGSLSTTFAAGAETVLLTGDLGYVAQVVGQLDAGSQVDARSALFRVSNSRNPTPSIDAPCDSGDLPVNRYPLQIRDSPGVTLRGGVFAGEVSLVSDWQNTYCNSTGAGLRGSPGAIVEDLRMRRVWDAIRISQDSSRFTIRSSWISETRDDCIENDYLNAGVIEDVLLDGCFSGLSMRPPKGEQRSAADGAVVLRGVLMRMQSYLYKGELQMGPPFKVDEIAPKIEIHDSIVAMDDRHILSKSRLLIGWAQIGQCSGNLLLWTADTPWPQEFEKPPACFRLVEGAEARALWQTARRNWINCHPGLTRFAEDPTSMPGDCAVGAYGGKYAHNR